MKKYILLIFIAGLLTSCSDFLDLKPEFQINEKAFYKTAKDFETALIGNYANLQVIHNGPLLNVGELTTDNARIEWSSPTQAEAEFDELNLSASNSILGSIWTSCFSTISNSNNLLARLDEVKLTDAQHNQFKGEALFLRAYNYFYLVRIFGELPIVPVAFRSPNEIMSFDMSRKPTSEVYNMIIQDLTEAAGLLSGINNTSKSRASVGAAKTLLGKVYLTSKQYDKARDALKEVVDMKLYSLSTDYRKLFTVNNDDLPESIFEIKYLSGNVGEGNSFSSIFSPSRFDLGMFPGNMQGSGRLIPTPQMANAYEAGDVRRKISIGDTVRLVSGKYEKEIHGLKFVDFTTGLVGDGGINFTSLRYADVLLMYAEALNETGNTNAAYAYVNQVRARAGLTALTGLSKESFALAMERERRVEFLLEGHRWFDLVRTERAKEVMNKYFKDAGLSYTVQDHELIMPIPLREIDIDPKLKQNKGF